MTALVLSWCVVRWAEETEIVPYGTSGDPINTISVATPSSHYSPILTNNVINIIDTQHNLLLMSFTFTPHDDTHDAQGRITFSISSADAQLFSTAPYIQKYLTYVPLSLGEWPRGSVGEAPYLNATDHRVVSGGHSVTLITGHSRPSWLRSHYIITRHSSGLWTHHFKEIRDDFWVTWLMDAFFLVI